MALSICKQVLVWIQAQVNIFDVVAGARAVGVGACVGACLNAGAGTGVSTDASILYMHLQQNFDDMGHTCPCLMCK